MAERPERVSTEADPIVVWHHGAMWHGAVPVLADVLPDDTLKAYVRAVPGAVTVEDVRQACARARAEGRSHVPPCDHVDARGYCRGHHRPEADTWGT